MDFGHTPKTSPFSLLVLATAGPGGSADRLYRSNPWFVYMPVSVAVLISPYYYQKVDGLWTYTENFSLLVLTTAGPEGSADRLYRSNPWFVYIAK